VYANGGAYGGLYAFRGSTGVETWFAGLAQYDLWTPAVDATYAYAHTGYEWVAIDRTAGERAFTVPNTSFNWIGYSLNIAPVIDAPGSILVVDGVYDYDTTSVQHANHLIRYSVAARGEQWAVSGRFVSNPAAAAGHVYALNAAGNRLEAYDASSGALLWHWSPADPDDIIPIGNVVVTDNLVFVSTSTTTYSVNLATHQSVWSVPHAGDLALSSNGVLYIVGPQRIDAYDLF
jgi:outer membrane protein assembly factor BamB